MILQQSFAVEENILYVKEKTNTWLYSQDTLRGDEKMWESKIHFFIWNDEREKLTSSTSPTLAV